MTVALDHHSPFILAHGGFQIQIEQTFLALRRLGIEVEWLRWWDVSRTPDIIHFFGKASTGYLRRAQSKGIRTIVSELHTGLGSHSQAKKLIQARVIALSNRFTQGISARMNWDSYRYADMLIALTPYEASLMTNIFHADRNRVRVVPNGVDAAFFGVSQLPREEWLLCTATITERKRVVELAKAAVLAGVKVKVLGRPYSEEDPYFIEFLDTVKRSDGRVEWCGEVTDRAALASYYHRARGFVLPSTMESLSLSALEAAACRCPLLLTDLPWARTTFGPSAAYLPDSSDPARIASAIRQFCAAKPETAEPFRVLSWDDVAKQLEQIYKRVLAR